MKIMNYPTAEEIVEINKRLSEGDVLVNKSNLEFVIDKAKNTKEIIRKATVFLYDIL